MITTIYELLESRLGDFAIAKNIKVAYENIAFIPNDNQIYLTSHLLPALTANTDSTIKVYNGVYQITVVTPLGTGKHKALTLADEICHLYQVNTLLSNADVIFFITTEPSILPAFSDKTAYFIPIRMNYWCTKK